MWTVLFWLSVLFLSTPSKHKLSLKLCQENNLVKQKQRDRQTVTEEGSLQGGGRRQVQIVRNSPAVQWLRIRLPCGRPGFDPWVGKIPWRREWQPTPVFLPGESYGQRSLAGYIQSMGSQSWTWLTIHTQHSIPVFKTLPSNTGVRVWFLIRELWSHMPRGQKTKT